MPARKILIYSGASILILIGLSLTAVFLFKDKIITRFVEEANKHIATPVKIGKMEIAVFRHFPQMSIEFRDVYVEDSYPEIFPLFTAKRVSFSFNAYDAWKGKYSIKSLTTIGSETNIRINAKGLGNFEVVKDTATNSQSLTLDLSNVRLIKQHFTYIDEQAGLSQEFNSSSLSADVKLMDNTYKISASGDVISNQVGIGKNVFLKDRLFNVDLSMLYDDKKKVVVFNPSFIGQEKSEFEIKGSYNFKDQPLLTLTLNGKKTSLQTIISFLPESMVREVRKYESVGDLYFKMDLSGVLPNPLIKINFGCRNATINHPETNFKITQANLTGSFSSIGLSRFSNAMISLKNISGKLNGRAFTSDFYLKNFVKPFVDFKFKGEVDVSSIKGLMDDSYVKETSGLLFADVSMVGEPALMKDKKTAQQVKVSGSLELKKFSLSTGSKGIDLRDVNGNLKFTNNDLAMSDVRGHLGKSDFLLNGFFKNVVSFVLFDNQPIGIETDLQSNFIDVEELMVMGFGKEASTEYQFKLSPNIHLNFDCRIGKLRYKKFNATDVVGDLIVSNQKAKAKDIKLKTMGGHISLSGILVAGSNKPIELVTSGKLKGIQLDSLFYIFGNFKQDFITDQHLKGKASADVSLEVRFTPALNLIPESLVSNIDITIKQGELNNFEPLQSLKNYLDDDGLKNLRFADLKNEIHIENQVILIPLMEVRTNVTTFRLSGRHSFDKSIDYRIVAPLRNKKKINVDEAGPAFEDQDGKMKVYFKITGNTDNYKVAYDTEAVKKKLSSDLKKEFAELKDSFNDKGKKKQKQLELDKDDYFDW